MVEARQGRGWVSVSSHTLPSHPDRLWGNDHRPSKVTASANSSQGPVTISASSWQFQTCLFSWLTEVTQAYQTSIEAPQVTLVLFNYKMYKQRGKQYWFIRWLIHLKSPQETNWEDFSPCRDGTYGLPVDGDQLIQHDVGAGEDAVRVEEGVQKVNGEEAQVSQALQ